ncbi:rlmI, partial [Symbiodinium pilosum]
VCRAYTSARFLDASHLSVLVTCCKFTLDEASASDLSHLATAAMKSGADGTEGLIKE